MPEWRSEAKSYQLSSKMETFIHQRDNHGNLVPGLHEFDIQVLIKGTKLSYPISDMRFMEVSPGIQSFTFTTTVPGDFILTISDKITKKQIMNMPYEFNVFVGVYFIFLSSSCCTFLVKGVNLVKYQLY